jgi:hypothetical protein
MMHHGDINLDKKSTEEVIDAAARISWWFCQE